MRRRKYLTLTGVAATATLAGCTGDEGDDDSPQEDNGADDTANGTDNGESNGGDNGEGENGEDEEPESAAFEVVDISHPESVTIGEEHTHEITVRNTGGQAGTFESDLMIDDGSGDTFRPFRTVQIEDVDGGESETVETEPVALESATTVRFRLGDTEWSYEVEPEPAEFEVIDAVHPESVAVGEEHTFEITVENSGGQVGTFESELEINDNPADQFTSFRTIEIEDISPGETGSIETEPITLQSEMTVQFRLGGTTWSYEVEIAQSEPQSFSGSGNEVREDIQIEGGLTVIEANYQQQAQFGNFQVSLVGEGESQYSNLFINVIGDFDGVQANLVDPGEYILDVTAEGDWEIELRQPRASDAPALPMDFDGEGPEVVGPVMFDGTRVASGSHEGESNFIVEIYPMEGIVPEIVFNQIDSFEGEGAYSFEGIGWVDVDADGPWTLEFD